MADPFLADFSGSNPRQFTDVRARHRVVDERTRHPIIVRNSYRAHHDLVGEPLDRQLAVGGRRMNLLGLADSARGADGDASPSADSNADTLG